MGREHVLVEQLFDPQGLQRLLFGQKSRGIHLKSAVNVIVGNGTNDQVEGLAAVGPVVSVSIIPEKCENVNGLINISAFSASRLRKGAETAVDLCPK